ncbi:hypothetical protein MUN84_17525 [Hymenobacter sp. 5516J-16]|uniref:hypothetical protein n=1 Tax=Hymenobacter sp. 5516J-16 TaxID=2932253 RepID=UPI001FD02A44|nr:hypothetical protein [Hymenobacter sp. 5516J-16]UOQ76351.1 hypothetical protein MUN84_17525 [Hymenobacter sp. 5516J-16]
MKPLSLALLCAGLLLTGCTKTTEQQTELAVQDFVRNRVSDPKNYFPGKFKFSPYTKRDSLLYLAQMAQINGQPAPPAPTPADSVRIGTLVYHDYRDEMRNGVSVRDSGEYVVRPNGDVRILMAESIRRRRLQK